MRINAVGHHGAIGSRDGRASWARRSSGRPVGRAGIPIRGTNAIRGLGGLSRLRRVRMAAQTRTFKEMLLLSRGVLCTNLLTVDTLHGETLYAERPKRVSYVSDAWGVVVGLKYYEIHSHAPCHLPWRGTRQTPRAPPGRRCDP